LGVLISRVGGVSSKGWESFGSFDHFLLISFVYFEWTETYLAVQSVHVCSLFMLTHAKC
jgi:hypothetical protein